MVLVQKWPLFQLLFLGKVAKGNVFCDILEGKKALLGYKNKKVKHSQNRHFSKGLTHGFGPKMAIFATFIFYEKQAKKMCFTIFQNKKNAFLAYKRKSSNTLKFDIFPEVNPWFWSKNGDFSNFYFLGNNGQENVFNDIPERKNAFLGFKNKKFKNSKNWHFSKWVNPCFSSKNGHFYNLDFLANKGQENVFYDILERRNASLGYKKKELQKLKKIKIFPWFWSKNGHFYTF